MNKLPKLPGYDFLSEKRSTNHVPQCAQVKNGYIIMRDLAGSSAEPPVNETISLTEKDEGLDYDPVLTYGRARHATVTPFRPHFVIYDRKCLNFKAFFKQSVSESPLEHYRVRSVNIIYFLEDDSITIMEPRVRNSGLPQGRILRRSKVAKNLDGECYTWKDFNVGIDMQFNGLVFHIADCDPFTKDFMQAQGIELNPSECMPPDPYTIEKVTRNIHPKESKVPKTDKLQRLLEFQGKVLRFDCIIDETDMALGEVRTHQLFYFLEDDTIAISELKENKEGRDRFPMFLRRTKVPKNWKGKPVDHPSIFLEVTDEEIREYYSPEDLLVGSTAFIFGRKFLLLDCDKFTRDYYEKVMKIPQKEKLCIKFPVKPKVKRSLPAYLGLGTPEDSLQSCFGFQLKPPKKDIMKYLINGNTYLRYGCIMDSAHPEDQNRKFILSYYLAEDTIQIKEIPMVNSGFIGGRYLAPTRVRVPGCDPDDPIYYSPKDFYIGAILKIFDHRFQITSADLFVYKYMRQNRELFSDEAIEGVRQYLLTDEKVSESIKTELSQHGREGSNKVHDEEIKTGKHLAGTAPVSDMEKNLQEICVQDDVSRRPIENIIGKIRDEKDVKEKKDKYELLPEKEFRN